MSLGTGSAALGAGLGASAGGAAVSLGLVFAPVWPIIAGIAGGAGIGYAAYKVINNWKEKPGEENS